VAHLHHQICSRRLMDHLAVLHGRCSAALSGMMPPLDVRVTAASPDCWILIYDKMLVLEYVT
jgi:hypothetical protein